MFGAGWTEMFIIGVVALVVIGPKDLPVVMRRIGRMVGTVRRMGSEFQRELNKTTGLDQITDLRRSITEPLRQSSEEIVREFNRQTSTGVEPSGVLKPTDPKVESVYDQIAANAGVSPTDGPVTVAPAMKPLAASAEPSPAPAEASAPLVAAAAKPRRTAKAKAAAPVAPPPAPKRASRAPAKAATAAVPKAAAAKSAKPTVAAAPAQPKPRAKPAVKVAAKTAATATMTAPVATGEAIPAAKTARARTKKA
ncbi:MAG: Sec-independent protein translocase protein TatB [Devosia sp.]|nr:Sec-independent protein translocase protein TatB [Devosia sp.]